MSSELVQSVTASAQSVLYASRLNRLLRNEAVLLHDDSS